MDCVAASLKDCTSPFKQKELLRFSSSNYCFMLHCGEKLSK